MTPNVIFIHVLKAFVTRQKLRGITKSSGNVSFLKLYIDKRFWQGLGCSSCFICYKYLRGVFAKIGNEFYAFEEDEKDHYPQDIIIIINLFHVD